MQISTERAKCPDMIVPSTESDSNVRDEVNRRTHKAGYTTRHGDPTFGTKIMGPGIGDSKLNQWPRDVNGKLIGD